MIQNKEDYKEYLCADKIANKIRGIRKYTCTTWKYLKCMRKIEYLANTKNGLFWQLVLFLYKQKLRKLSEKLGISIPPNTFGKGLYIPHYGAIVINPNVRFGDYCIVQNCTNISENVWGAIIFI